MDIIILLILLIIVVVVFKNFNSVVYFICCADIFLRIIRFIATHIGISEVRSLLVKYFPSSIPGIISSYTSGIVEDCFMWLLVLMYIIFLFYAVRSLIKH